MKRTTSSPEPHRTLGAAGLAYWNAHAPNLNEHQREKLLLLCEQIDERIILRINVLRSSDSEQRRALRQLDRQIREGMSETAARTDRSKVTGRKQELEWLRDTLAASLNQEPDGAKRALIAREYRRILEILESEFPNQSTTKVDELANRRAGRNTVTSDRKAPRSRQSG